MAAAALLAPTAAAAAPASQCDAYSHTCVKPLHVFRQTSVLPRTTPTSSQLPFTGADIALMSLAGIAAIGGGSALVIIGRRRRTVSPD